MEHLRALESRGVINALPQDYVRCAWREDSDFAQRIDPDCSGKITLDSSECQCPVCDQLCEYNDKKVWREYIVMRDEKGVLNFLRRTIEKCSPDIVVNKVRGKDQFLIELRDKTQVRVGIAERFDSRSLTSSLTFGEPTLYIVAEPTMEPSPTLLGAPAWLSLAEVIVRGRDLIAERLKLISVGLRPGPKIGDLEARFDDMLMRHTSTGSSQWSFFEQAFMPRFWARIREDPERADKYLKRLHRFEGTVFGEFQVAIGGGGNPDFRSISKIEWMTCVFRDNSIGDAKCYGYNTPLSPEDIKTITLHTSQSAGAQRSIVLVSNDNVQPATWASIFRINDAQRFPRIVVLPKHLILELILELEITDILDF